MHKISFMYPRRLSLVFTSDANLKRKHNMWSYFTVKTALTQAYAQVQAQGPFVFFFRFSCTCAYAQVCAQAKHKHKDI